MSLLRWVPGLAWGLLGWAVCCPDAMAAAPTPVPVALRADVAPDATSATIVITIANQSDATSAPGILEVYLSPDGLVDDDDYQVVRHPIGAMKSKSLADIELTEPLPNRPPGQYYLVARILSEEGLPSHADALWGAPMALGPDLTLADVLATNEAGTIAVRGRVINQGTDHAASTTVTAQWIDQETETFHGSGVATGIPDLVLGSDTSFEVLMPSDELTTGRFLVSVTVDRDDRIAESEETNNGTTADLVLFAGPDLVITTLSARRDGDGLIINDSITNVGTQRADACGILFVLSRNGRWDSGDITLGYRIVPTLAANATSDGQTRFTFRERNLETGRYFLIAKVDGSDHVFESREDNNLTIAPQPLDLKLQSER